MEKIQLNIDGTLYETQANRTFNMRKPYTAKSINQVFAPIPGTCISVAVTKGQSVKKGDILVLFNAMKMHNRVIAPIDGTVQDIHISAGQVFKKGQLFVDIA
jgi:biotin carboxyl carrier protein